MSETTACGNCGVQVPSVAVYCTACGAPMSRQAAPTGEDPTRVDGPPLADPTTVGPVGGSPWAAQPTTAPWNPPTDPPPPAWQQPIAPPGPPTAGHPAPWAGAATPPPPSWDPAKAPSAQARNAPSLIGGLAALIGTALTVTGLLSAWVIVSNGGNDDSITGWALTTGDEAFTSNDPYLLAGLALVAAVGAVLLFLGLARTLVRVGLALVGFAIIGITGLNWLAITDYVTDNLATSFQVRTGVGFYTAIAGGVVTMIAAALPSRR